MPESLLPMPPVQFLSQGAHMAPSETTSRLRPEASVLLGFVTVPFLLKRAPAGPLAKPCCCSAPPAQRASLGAAGKPFCPALSQKREPGDSGSFNKDRERCFSSSVPSWGLRNGRVERPLEADLGSTSRVLLHTPSCL